MQTFGHPQTGVWLWQDRIILICVKQVTLRDAVAYGRGQTLEPLVERDALTGGAPQPPASAKPGSDPCRTRALGQRCLAGQGFTRSYDIAYGGLKLRRVSAALGQFHPRRGAGLPQVGRLWESLANSQTPWPMASARRWHTYY